MEITEIMQIGSDKITDVLDAVLLRYNELFPDWEITALSIEKCRDKNEQIDRVIRMLESLKM